MSRPAELRLQRAHRALLPVRIWKIESDDRFGGFRFFCEICGTGCGVIPCEECDGFGTVATRPGGAGEAFYVGMARCRACNGAGLMPCPMCAGWEDQMMPPEPVLGPAVPEGAYFTLDDTLAWLNKLFPDARPQQHRLRGRRRRRHLPARKLQPDHTISAFVGSEDGLERLLQASASVATDEWLGRFRTVKEGMRRPGGQRTGLNPATEQGQGLPEPGSVQGARGGSNPLTVQPQNSPQPSAAQSAAGESSGAGEAPTERSQDLPGPGAVHGATGDSGSQKAGAAARARRPRRRRRTAPP